MRRLGTLLYSMVLATISALTLWAQNSASIEGRVTNSITGEPLGGVNVRFLDRRSHVYSTVSDSTGSYRVTGLDDGDYQGEFTRAGFMESRANPFSRVAGFVPTRVDMQLKPWAALSGRVVDEDAMPAAGVRVEIDPHPRMGTDPYAVTDENGAFVFQNLAPGSYTAVAKPAPKIRIQDDVRLGTVATWYPAATEAAQAVRIPLRTGQNASGVEIRLKTVPVHRVAGVVLNEAGKPAAHATVKLMGRAGTARQMLTMGMRMPTASVGAGGMIVGNFRPAVFTMIGPSPELEVARVKSHDDGTFEFAAVEPGDWRLSVEAGVEGAEDEMPLGGVASALVSDKDVEDIPIRLARSFAVEVTVDWGSAQPPTATAPAATPPAATQRRAVPLGLTAMEGQPRAIVDDPATNAGKMNTVFPGRYRVIPNVLQLGYLVVAVMWGGRDVNGEVVDLMPGAAPFQIILSSESGRVRGAVDKSDKSEGATVFLVSSGPGEILTYRQVQCQADAFEFSDVPPGQYYVLAFDQTGILPPDDLPAAIVPIASNVRVEAGSTAPVDLKVNKWPW